jgi:hypothetical protein
MERMIRFTAVALIFTVAFTMQAQPSGAGGRGPGGMIIPVMAALDEDKDGVISASEIQNAEKSLTALDKNGDGKIDNNELRPSFGSPGGRSSSKGRGGSRRGDRAGRDGRGGEPRIERIPPEQLEFNDGVGAVPDLATYNKLSYQGPQVMVDTHLADWKFVKFQIEDVGKGEPVLYFVNTKTHRGHPMFMRKIGIDRGDGSMRGVLVYRPLKKAPNGEPGMFTFEYEPNDRYPFDRIKLSYEMLTRHMPYLEGRLGYYPMPRARPVYFEEKTLYDAAEFPVVLDEDLESDIGFLPLNAAESYGRLRLMELGELPSSRDIVVYKTLPNEMPRVAGVITAVRQTPLSHVNLRAVQDGVPNAFVTGAVKNETITSLAGKLVYYKVDKNGYELREATEAEVDKHFAAIRPVKPQSPKRDLSVGEIRPLDKISFGDSAVFGVKAANLATLHTIDFPEGTVPSGHAVPFSFYDAYMKHNGLYDKAREMLTDKAFQKNRDTQIAQLKAFRKTIKAANMPDWMMERLAKLQSAFPEGLGIRCRSSTNNEDLPGFSGAGLYDSFTHKPSEGHLAKSIKQVFASLWNFRAFEEREFYRIDHFTTAMGVLVHPNFSDEAANGVAVTDDILYQTKGNYYLNTQVGENLVTNPEANSIPEELLLNWWKPDEHKVMRHSSLARGNALLMSDKHLTQMNECLGKIHARFAKLYGKPLNDKKFAMEIEYKITKDGNLSIKQARPWVY